MRKLKLEIEELTVESFATGAGTYRAGTVKGRQDEFAGYDNDDVAIGEDAEAPAPATASCPVVTYCASCVNTCDACTQRTCASGAPVCCA